MAPVREREARAFEQQVFARLDALGEYVERSNGRWRCASTRCAR
jgi:hypothetical protein